MFEEGNNIFLEKKNRVREREKESKIEKDVCTLYMHIQNLQEV